MIAYPLRPPRLSLALLTWLPALLAVIGGCASAGVPMGEIAAEVNATLAPHPARFLPGDGIKVKFAETTQREYDQDIVVDPEGGASFLMLGRLEVLGKSAEQLEGELKQAYASKLPSADLSVNLTGASTGSVSFSVSNRPIHVLGEVQRPTSFPYVGTSMTLVEALAAAGSFDKRSALLKQVLLVRWMPSDRSYRAWKIDARPKHWGAPQQILLQPHDVIFVPQKPIDKVNIWVDQYIRQMIPFPYLIPPTP